MEAEQTSVDSSRLWDEKAAASFLGVSCDFLQQDRIKHRRIPFIKLGRAVRYDPADVRAYIEKCKVRGQA
jgi:excisionase family DNA binding protein